MIEVKTVEVSHAYKHDRYENIGFENLQVMSNVDIFATQYGQSDRKQNMHHYTDPCDTH